jgi:hypothetical protein
MRPRHCVFASLVVLLHGFITSARAADDDRRAIQRGIAALKEMRPEKTAEKSHQTGIAALIGLTLLECGIPATDPSVQQALAQVRTASPELNHTYSLSLAIMFLDRNGDAGDVPLLHAMAVRLLAGQNSHGGWSYTCPRPSSAEVQRLNSWLRERGDSPRPIPLPKEPAPLPKEVQEQIDALAKPTVRKDGDDFQQPGDNSNTQFATLGLWIARRHGIPIDKAMARVETRFRNSQHSDGGWGYIPAPRGHGGLGSTASMTCAGLLGLAMSHGAANEAALRTNPKAKPPREPAKDPAVRAGLLALGTAVGRARKGKANAAGPVMQRGYYFLWSLERVAVAYSLNTVGSKDWHAWGCEMLLQSQGPDGTWKGEHGPEVDTCFALLFLRRVNLAKDLTATLKGVEDPGEVTLKAGGVGGEGLLAKGLKSGIVMGDSDAGEAARMSFELIQAAPDQQDRVLEKLRDGKGAVYTDALGAAIPQLGGAARTRARDALAERLGGMTADTLRAKLQDDLPEVRRAAAIACYMKDDKNHVPDLIVLLDDAEPSVARAAHAALKGLTGQDLGPAKDPSPAERARAINDWKAWWKKQTK